MPKKQYKQTRRSVSVSGVLHEAMKIHCERAGLSISGYVEMIMRREMGMETRDPSTERSPILMEAHRASKERLKASKTTVPDPPPPVLVPEPPPVISDTYEEPLGFAEEEGNRESPAPKSTTKRRGGRIEPMPGPVEVFYLQVEPDLQVPVLPTLPSQESILAHEDVPEPVSEPEIERESDPGEPEPVPEVEEPEPEPELEPEVEEEPESEVEEEPEVEVEVEEDPRPIHAIRMDRPSREFLTKGERERAERAALIAERQRVREAEEKAEREKAAEVARTSRRSGNVFSF